VASLGLVIIVKKVNNQTIEFFMRGYINDSDRLINNDWERFY